MFEPNIAFRVTSPNKGSLVTSGVAKSRSVNDATRKKHSENWINKFVKLYMLKVIHIDPVFLEQQIVNILYHITKVKVVAQLLKTMDADRYSICYELVIKIEIHILDQVDHIALKHTSFF